MNEKKEYGWKLKEIILVAMICIVFGVVYLGGVYLASFLSTLLTPVGLAPLANEIVFGVWFMAARPAIGCPAINSILPVSSRCTSSGKLPLMPVASVIKTSLFKKGTALFTKPSVAAG